MLQTNSSVRSHFSCVFVLLAFVMCFAHAARAQSALDGFDPNANGSVRIVVVQPDGKILIGGAFTTLSPNGGTAVTRNHIARLNPDGTLDTTFDPNVDGSIVTIAVQGNGQILIGGLFTTVSPNGAPAVTRNNIARLNADGTLDANFDPNADSQVAAIAVQSDGKILVGGLFTSIGGQTQSFIARLDATTGMADSFNPNANANISAIALQADGKILLGGSFTNIGGQVRNRIARLDPVTGLADSFDPNAGQAVFSIAIQADGKILAGGSFLTMGGQQRHRIARLDPVTGAIDSFNPIADNTVTSVVVQADGKVLLGGFFTTIGPSDRPAGPIGQPRNYIARIDPITGLPDSFRPTASQTVFSIAVQQDGKILAGGLFTTLAPNGGSFVTRNNIARLETDGLLDKTADPNASETVTSLAVQADGKVLVGGSFSTIGGQSRSGIARLNSDGTVDTTFNAGSVFGILTIILQSDGRILIGGGFTSVAGQVRNRIARLNQDGSLDTAFDPNAGGNEVRAMALQPDGKIMVGGFFSSMGGQTMTNITRLNPDGVLDTTFNNVNNGIVNSVALQSDGKIVIGGGFTSVSGQPRSKIARLNPDGSLDAAFNPNVTSPVGPFLNTIVIQSDGKIIIGGFFTAVGGQNRYNIARLSQNGSVDVGFLASANGSVGVQSLSLQSDGKILAGGPFTEISGGSRTGIARLNPDGTLDASFDPVAQPSQGVFAIAINSDGKIWLGGSFQFFGGIQRNRIARLSNSTGAFQNLTGTRTAVEWTLDGSAPEFTRTTFEISTDGANYTSLGAGSRIFNSSHWTLTGLDLPIGQNLWIRARGYYPGGQYNGSGSVNESVRNVFFTGLEPSPTSTLTATSTNTPTNTPTSTPTASGTPILYDYIDVAVDLSGNISIPPESLPQGASTISVSSSTSFDGVLTVDPATGIVDIVNAKPAGMYVINVKAQNSFGSFVKTFTLTVNTVAACSELTFRDPINHVSTGNNPRRVAIGDFNRDGIQDFAVARNPGPAVVIFLGTGSGGFHLVGTVFPGVAPNSISVGDFNGDGIQDLVTANTGTDNDNVSVFIGTGTGGFAPGVNYNLGTSVALDIGDFNNDGRQDLAIVAAGSIRIALGSGFGSFSSGTLLSLNGNQGRWVTVGDFNGDGNSDIAVANGSISVFLGTGNGSFGPRTEFGVIAAQFIAIGDFNGDGVQDLATANTQVNSVSILLGTGSGTFGAPITYSGLNGQPNALAVADFNGDGNQDVVISNVFSTITILLGAGNGSFSSRTNFGETTPMTVVVGDFNGDGLQDIAVPSASSGPNYLSIYIRTCPAITGTVTYGNAIGAPTPRFVSNVLLSGAGSVPVSAFSSFPNGTYSLSGFGSGAYTVTPSKTGGVNGISSFDSARVAQHVAGINTLTGNQLIVADVSGNGTVSSFDAAQIARYSAGLAGSGTTGNWIFVPVNRNYALVSGNIKGEDFVALLMGEVSGNWTNTAALSRR